MTKRILFLVDDYIPTNSAAAVRMAHFVSSCKNYHVEVLGGSSEPEYEDDRLVHGIDRPQEQSVFRFVVFLARIMYRSWRLSRGRRFDVIVLSIPKYEMLLIAPLLARNTAVFVLDVRDSIHFLDYRAYLGHFLPDYLAKLCGYCADRIIHWLYRRALKVAALITVANTGILLTLAKSQSKAVVVSNGVDVEIFKPSGRNAISPSGTLNLVYVGNFAEKDRFDVILDALQSLKDRTRIHLIGSGRNKPEVLRSFAERDIEYCDHGMYLHKDLPDLLKQMNIGFIFRDEDVGESIPVAIYEFASMNLPTLCNNVGLMAEFVREHKLGYVVDNPADLTAVISSILAKPEELEGFAGLHELAANSFSRQAESAKFESLISELIKSSKF